MPTTASPAAAFALLAQALRASVATNGSPARHASVDGPASELLAAREVDGVLARVGAPPGPWAALQRAVWDLQLAALGEFVDALLAAGVRPVVLKGAELISRYFRDTPMGFLVDADVLVRRDDVQIAKRVLYELGYTQSYFDLEAGALAPRDVGALGRIEAEHYELGPFCREAALDVSPADLERVAARADHPVYAVGDRCTVVLEIDVHHSVAADVDPAPLLDRAVPSTCCAGLTLSPADHLWVNCSRFYNEVALFGKRTLRPLVYTAPLLTEEEVDWDVVTATAREIELTASLYYPLRTLEALTGAQVPGEVLDAVHPRHATRDLGWQLGALFGFVEPFPFEGAAA